MKGFRTILVSLFSLITSMIYGTQLDITPMQHGIVNAFLAASFSAIILLRMVTNTPAGKAAVEEIDKDIGLTPEMKAAIEQTIGPLIAPLLAQVPQGASMAALVDSMQKLHTSVDEVKTLATTTAVQTAPALAAPLPLAGMIGGVGGAAGTMIFSNHDDTTKPAT